jgi:hypothetical protein
MAIGNILWTFGIFYDHLVHFVILWYFLSGFGIMRQEKSGNPDETHCQWASIAAFPLNHSKVRDALVRLKYMNVCVHA